MLKFPRGKILAGAIAGMVMAGAVTTFMLTGDPAPLNPHAQYVLGPLTPIGATWYDQTEVSRGKVHGGQCPATLPADVDAFTMLNYYDLPQVQYVNYQRTNEAAFLDLARKCADVWWKYPDIGEGLIRKWPDSASPAPRHAGVGGLILRAMDGRPEMWDWINAYTRFNFDHWLKKRTNDPSLFYGLREGAFVLDYATWLARTLPDSFPLQAGGTATNGAQLRAAYLADIENVVVNYFGRLQQADGSWRWDDPDFTDSDGGQLKGVMQPFMVGLLLTALVDVHQLTTNATVKANVANQITKACRHLYLGGPYSTQRIASLNVNLRGFHYFYHGGTTVNPTRYATGSYPANYNTTDRSDVQNARQAIALIVDAFGYAFKITGDLFFKTAGDELWDAAYGSTDGIRNYMAGDAKSYNQNVRRAGTYLGWMAGQAQPSPTATPSLSPSPSPTATIALPTVTPTPTVAPTATPRPSASPTATPTPIPQPSPCQVTAWPSSAQGQNSKMDERRGQGCYPFRRSGNSMEYTRP